MTVCSDWVMQSTTRRYIRWRIEILHDHTSLMRFCFKFLDDVVDHGNRLNAFFFFFMEKNWIQFRFMVSLIRNGLRYSNQTINNHFWLTNLIVFYSEAPFTSKNNFGTKTNRKLRKIQFVGMLSMFFFRIRVRNATICRLYSWNFIISDYNWNKTNWWR